MDGKRFKLKWDDGQHITFIKDTLNKKEYHMLMDDVRIVKLLNEQDQKIKELEQELFAEKVQRLDERLAEYGGPDDEKVWQEEFGMSQREAKKKAGWSDWCYYPE